MEQMKKRYLKRNLIGRKQCYALLFLGAIVVWFHLCKGNASLMEWVAQTITTPLKTGLGILFSFSSASVGEWMIYVGVLGTAVYIGASVWAVIKSEKKLVDASLRLLNFLVAAMAVYAIFCVNWSVNCYGYSFAQKANLSVGAVEVEELERVTQYFAQQVGKASKNVKRDENNLFVGDLETILEQSTQVYLGLEQEFSFLQGRALKTKGVRFSPIMSHMNLTGFFFPITGEANVNVHSPLFMLPATIAHEVAHQRGIAPEQEANFAAILSSTTCNIPEYVYSGYVLGYIHLSNALYSADKNRWQRVAQGLEAGVVADLNFNNTYWSQYETPIADAAEQVNDAFIKSNGQTLGVKSYGAVVDLLVAYYNIEGER